MAEIQHFFKGIVFYWRTLYMCDYTENYEVQHVSAVQCVGGIVDIILHSPNIILVAMQQPASMWVW